MLNGVICINKEQNMTSHDVCFKVRKILKTRKVGHSGTLDPMATGVMGVLVGRSTKLSDYITSQNKEYIASMRFGKISDSFDIWTETRDINLPKTSEEEMKEVVRSFIGDIVQTPPIYSAIKVNGKALYKYARNNESVEIPSRKVHVDDIEILELKLPEYMKIKVKCSKGTYIRSLISDIGKKAGSGAVMDSLIRTRNGNLNIEKSYTLFELEELVESDCLDKALQKDDLFLQDYKRVDIKSDSKKYLLNGNPLLKKNIITELETLKENELIRLYVEGKFIGLGKRVFEDDVLIRPAKILYGE